MVAGPLPAAPRARYGWDRIVAGARVLSDLDPGWWREDALPPASLAALDMADPYRCVLAWWAAQHLPVPPRRGSRQVSPYDRAVRALHLSSQQAQALGFTGVDADRLTPGWRHLITCLRASHDRRAAADPAPGAVQSRGVLLAQPPAGAPCYNDELRGRGKSHNMALRRLAGATARRRRPQVAGD